MCTGAGVIDRGRHNSLRQVLQHINTSLQLSGHGDDDHGGRGGGGAHHAGARAHLARDETDEEGAAHVLFDARGVVPVPGVGHHDRGVADHDSVVGAGGGALRGGDDEGQLGRGLVPHL